VQLIALQPPDPVTMLPVKFKVFSKKNLDEAVGYIESEGAVIVLTVKDYENLSRNMADLYRYIDSAVFALNTYKKQVSDYQQACKDLTNNSN
jgi:hypothetical protein